MGKRRQNEQDFHFDFYFFRRLYPIATLLFPRFDSAVFFMIATLLASIASEVVTFFIGQVPGDMYTALSSLDERKFWHIFIAGSFEYIGKCLILALVSFLSWMLYLSWRSNAIQQLSDRYFKNGAYYNINCIDDHGIDNPDQRMTQDVERMCNKLAVDVLPSILIGPFVVAWYTYQTAQTAGGLGIAIIYGYFVLGTVVNKILLSPMVKWNGRVEKAEGDFRFKHVTLRNNAESSALYNAAAFERYESDRLFNVLWWRQFRFMMWKLPNFFWQQLFDYYGAILSYAIQFVPVFINHLYDHTPPAELAGIISKNAFVYIYLVNSFTRMTDVALSIGEVAGIMQRVSEFMRICELEQHQQLARKDSENDSDFDGGYDNFAADTSSTKFDPQVTVENGIIEERNQSEQEKKEDKDIDLIYDIVGLSYSQPDDQSRRMLEGLTMQIRSTSSIVITGPSGCGKSSLIRVIAGLWKQDSGTIKRRKPRNYVMFVPQTPYFPSGHLTLRQQIAFPNILPQFRDTLQADNEQLEGILSALDLNHLIKRCNGFDSGIDFEWQETLTPGEQQRLSFARILYQRPIMAILDESTSSVSVSMEETMYRLLQQNGIHYVSVGHRPTLIDFHDFELRLTGHLTYEIRPLPASAVYAEKL
uniref:ABC transporter domain-containing protein n=1 Tax=Parascaris univalens TaxID=6257 RepID=A0A915AKD2_PARUN